MSFKGTRWFYEDSPEELSSLDELCEHLHSLLSSSTVVDDDRDPDGPILIEMKHLVERLGSLKIEIYSDEHPPPHFHVITPNSKASFRLDNCELLEGNLPNKYKRKVEYWFYEKNAKKALISFWDKTRPTNCTVGKYAIPD
ncbi:DUF4160 domain-containing protein [Pseudoalteromonas sp. SR43-3]|uniref:DUF4160 domain-containing protein n=1 Tax=Pseudoalteromonas sp. SR43-3 TaxID=2760943 RepID=UPI0016049016|nr:DUF4160 domain-containing protein [Pseudoalteromonas sp. SR43-3]MBB1276329.1 DUF4160 domain-containing protein [Pseudoalteromonas sp. SR43-3]